MGFRAWFVKYRISYFPRKLSTLDYRARVGV